jgi:hypothetical protein
MKFKMRNNDTLLSEHHLPRVIYLLTRMDTIGRAGFKRPFLENHFPGILVGNVTALWWSTPRSCPRHDSGGSELDFEEAMMGE